MFNLSWSVGTIPHYRLIQKLESFIGDEYKPYTEPGLMKDHRIDTLCMVSTANSFHSSFP